MDKYLKALKQNVCTICVDSTEKGACTLDKSESCALELFYPQIMEIVLGSKDEEISIIHTKLRATICSNCRDGAEESCYLRKDANCSLDRYFPLIVETIQRVESGKL